LNVPFPILYEDNHLIAINKQAGQLVQADKTGDEALPDQIKAYIKDKYNKPGDVFLGVIHRIDRPVSGVCLFARTSKALERMNEKFRERDLNKTYWAILKHKPHNENGKLVHWLVKDHDQNRTKAHLREVPGSKRAELDFELIGERAGYYLLKVTPLTGRPHQIRVQLSTAIGPIVGDLKYGYPEANSDGSICLHARELTFTHPVQKVPVKITAAAPKLDIWKLF
jgi:23S rRNA pseudouridine1911/1915/1917 synthase